MTSDGRVEPKGRYPRLFEKLDTTFPMILSHQTPTIDAMKKRITKWETNGPYTAKTFGRLCKKLVESGNTKYQLLDALRDCWDLFTKEEIDKLYAQEKKYDYIDKALDGKVYDAYRFQPLDCIMCDAPFQRGDKDYGLCTTCSNNDKEVLCDIHLKDCDRCDRVGCSGCGTVNNCAMCDVTLCEDCMGDAACSDCQRLYYCERCLKKGKCDACRSNRSGSDDSS